MTFEQVMQLTRTISSSAAFEEPECRAYFDILMSLKPGAVVAEIGLQFGRSSSIALQVAKEIPLIYVGMDPFVDPPEAIHAWVDMARKVGNPYGFTLVCADSKESFSCLQSDCLLVDGNHWEEYVKNDIHRHVSCVYPGGYALFHDFGEHRLPDVYPTVDADFVRSLMPADYWEELPTVGCLGIFRRKP